MRAKVRHSWENLKASLWFVPSVMVLGALALAWVLGGIDVALGKRESWIEPWFFSGTAASAQTVLAVVAGSLVTVISIAYSVTIVAIQQMAAQFTPRVLRNFTADRSNQAVLGAYMATFVYALLVMRQVRSPESEPGFVPALSVTVALILALACLGLLIYFIHHLSQLLQVSHFMDNVHDALVEEIDSLYPEGMGTAAGEDVADSWREEDARLASDREVVQSTEAGYVRSIDAQTLFAGSDGHTPWLFVRPEVGDFVPHGCVLVEFPRGAAISAQQRDQIRGAFVIDTERTLYQDPLFGIRQLVDIALKALSPAINDPTTAEYSLSHLGDVLGRLADRPFPSRVRLGPSGETRYHFSRPTWAAFVDAAFGQIRRQAHDNVHVTNYLLRVLYELALRVPPGERGRAIQREVDGVRYVLDRGQFSPADTEMLARQCSRVEAALQQQSEAAVPLRPGSSLPTRRHILADE